MKESETKNTTNLTLVFLFSKCPYKNSLMYVSLNISFNDFGKIMVSRLHDRVQLSIYYTRA